jgi:hypothetical protein
MDRNHEKIRDEDRQRFDLLADGELSEAERRELLLSLDHRPNGWRDCALALLEAECWSREMAAIGGRCVQPVVAGPRVRRSAGPWSSGTRWATLAASLVTAFFLGIAARDAVTPNTGNGRGLVADAEPSPANLPLEFPQTHAAPVASVPPAAHVNDVSDGPPSADPGSVAFETGQVQASAAPADPWNRQTFEPPAGADMVTFLIRGGDGPSTRAVQVPLISATGLSEGWRPPHASAIPDPILQRLRQAGHQIKWQRRYAPLQLSDGRQIVFPVDDVEITPVSCRTY